MGSSVDLHSRHVKERCLGTHLVLEDSSDDFSSGFFYFANDSVGAGD